MCNLNVFIKTKNALTIPSEQDGLMGMLMAASTQSFIHNPDSEGIWTECFYHRSRDKINLFKYAREINNSSCIFIHERIATSGRSFTYAQPFENDQFVLMHNGVMSYFQEGEKSDTYVFFEKFSEEFNNGKLATRDLNITEAIKKLLDNQWGSYSIFIFDKVTKAIYYFKNDSPSMHWCKSNDQTWFYATTNTSNQEYLKMLDIKYYSIIPKSYVIYKIVVTDKVAIFKLARIKKPEFKPVPYSYPYNSSYYHGAYDDGYYDYHDPYYAKDYAVKNRRNKYAQEISSEEEVETFEKNGLTIMKTKLDFECMSCSGITENLVSETGNPICDLCLDNIKKMEEKV